MPAAIVSASETPDPSSAISGARPPFLATASWLAGLASDKRHSARAAACLVAKMLAFDALAATGGGGVDTESPPSPPSPAPRAVPSAASAAFAASSTSAVAAASAVASAASAATCTADAAAASEALRKLDLRSAV